MAEQLPAPRLLPGGRTEQAEGIAELSHHQRRVDQFAEETVEFHRFPGALVARLAEACPHDVEAGVAHRLRHFVQPKPMVLYIKLGVLPIPPLVRGHGKTTRRPLLRREGFHQPARGLGHGLGGRLLRPEGEKTGDDPAVRGDAPKRFGPERLPVIKQLLHDRPPVDDAVGMGTGILTGDRRLAGGRDEAAVFGLGHGAESIH